MLFLLHIAGTALRAVRCRGQQDEAAHLMDEEIAAVAAGIGGHCKHGDEIFIGMIGETKSCRKDKS